MSNRPKRIRRPEQISEIAYGIAFENLKSRTRANYDEDFKLKVNTQYYGVRF